MLARGSLVSLIVLFVLIPTALLRGRQTDKPAAAQLLWQLEAGG